jgi:hypothetical protein
VTRGEIPLDDDGHVAWQGRPTRAVLGLWLFSKVLPFTVLGSGDASRQGIG